MPGIFLSRRHEPALETLTLALPCPRYTDNLDATAFAYLTGACFLFKYFPDFWQPAVSPCAESAVHLSRRSIKDLPASRICSLPVATIHRAHPITNSKSQSPSNRKIPKQSVETNSGCPASRVNLRLFRRLSREYKFDLPDGWMFRFSFVRPTPWFVFSASYCRSCARQVLLPAGQFARRMGNGWREASPR
jgi:hypothetical protein